MNKYRNLIRRVAYLESLLFEGKQDQENLLNFLGQDYYDKYNLIKNKITDPEYKDIYKLMKKDIADVEDYIDNLEKKQSNMDLRRKAKDSGAKLIYNRNGWKVYRITTYEAAVQYGKGTKWCITSKHDEGRWYFNNYIVNSDGGYYFYINTKNDNEKYCLILNKNGSIRSIWNAQDHELDIHEVRTETPDFPSVPTVLELSDNVDDYTLDNLSSGNLDLIRNTLRSGIDVNKLYNLNGDTSDAQTVLCFYSGFVKKYAVSIVEWLLENGADPNKSDMHGKTPLTIACSEGNTKAVELLLMHNANTNKTDRDGHTPLLLAINRNNIEVVRLLLDFDADVNILGIDGKTPLYIACEEGNAELVKLLLRYDADPEKGDTHSSRTPLLNAISSKRLDIAELLLKNGADPNNQLSDYVDTPLYLACRKQYKLGIELLLKYHADTNKQCCRSTPLIKLCEYEDPELIELLVRYGADVDAVPIGGSTPLTTSCSFGNLRNIEVLLNFGADVNKKDGKGSTPLSIACDTRNKEIINFLLRHGAKINNGVDRKLNELGLL